MEEAKKMECYKRLIYKQFVKQFVQVSGLWGPQLNSENKPQGLYFSKALFGGLIFGGTYIRRGLYMEENLLFKIDWACLIVGRKFTVFALFYFVFDLTEGFLRYKFGGLIFGGIYTWRGLSLGILRYLPKRFTHLEFTFSVKVISFHSRTSIRKHKHIF